MEILFLLISEFWAKSAVLLNNVSPAIWVNFKRTLTVFWITSLCFSCPRLVNLGLNKLFPLVDVTS